MQHLWIVASLAAAFFQALRYAALKELNRHLSASVATYVRMLFGLPFLAVYLIAVLHMQDAPLPKTNIVFWVCCSLTAFQQFAMTILMVWLVQHGNFAVGMMIQRADVILTAIIGSLLFSEVISGLGWVAIAITVAGVLAASAARVAPSAWSRSATLGDILRGPPLRLGFGSALCAAVSYLALREAIHTLDPAAGPLVN
jgi:drug/metabolite transporter (DMT)-like permease